MCRLSTCVSIHTRWRGVKRMGSRGKPRHGHAARAGCSVAARPRPSARRSLRMAGEPSTRLVSRQPRFRNAPRHCWPARHRYGLHSIYRGALAGLSCVPQRRVARLLPCASAGWCLCLRSPCAPPHHLPHFFELRVRQSRRRAPEQRNQKRRPLICDALHTDADSGTLHDPAPAWMDGARLDSVTECLVMYPYVKTSSLRPNVQVERD